MQKECNGQDIQTVWFDRGSGGLQLLRIYNRLGEATIYLHGAHIASYKPRGKADLLYMSPFGVFEEGKPIRGGIPICFPWFGQHPTDSNQPLHGLVRTMKWRLDSHHDRSDGSTVVSLVVEDNEHTRSVWPHRFSLTLTVTVADRLTVTLEVTNTGDESFSCSAALHTYYAVGALSGVTVDGLDGLSALDRATAASFVQEGSVEPNGVWQKLYYNSGEHVRLTDPSMGRQIDMQQSGWANILIWNPGEAALANAEICDSWQDFLCVEHVNNEEGSLKLQPSQSTKSTLTLSLT